MKTVITILLLVASISIAMAEGLDARIGLAGGQSSYDTIEVQASTSYELSYGQEISDNFFGEISLINFGAAEFGVDAEDLSMETIGVNFSLIGSFPFTENSSVYAKLGYMSWVTNFEGGSLNENVEGTDANYGVGYQYDTNSAVSFFTEYRAFVLGGTTIYNYNLGMSLRF